MAVPLQKKKMLGEMLIAEGIITRGQLERALAEQKIHGGRLGVILRNLGYVSEDSIIKVLGKQMGISHMSLDNVIVEPTIVRMIPETVARRYQAIPLYKKGNVITVAMVDPLNVFAIDDIRRITGSDIQTVVSTERDILKAIDRFYSVTSTMQEAIKDFASQAAVEEGIEERPIALEIKTDDAPVIKLVNMMITQAVRDGASDIHVEPDEKATRIRYRVDGILHEVMTPPKHLQAGISSRIKILANLDISEKRAPQDGRFNMNVGEKSMDIRVSTLPTIFGEKIVMRLLNKGTILPGLEDLGFSATGLNKFKKMITKPYGFILVSGPTGSGKTTTLYSALNTINSMEKNIITIEDPVEYQLNIVNQVQINPKAGVTFATGLRSILRQDPDIVMVGEVRDKETAVIAVQAALTGHLVFSTLHTNDAPGAVARLIDMGIEPFLIASSLMIVVGQRLVRKVCQKCKRVYKPTEELIKELGIPDSKDITFVEGAGCQDCRGTGYSGRIALFEVLVIDEDIRNLIVAKASSTTIRTAAFKTGFTGLREEGLDKAIKGITTLEEVLRVTQEIVE
ncbi:MAG: type II secretion system ATPase GspE [Nitrospirae bacterium]|nr:type II secretion system ATPase GspE [Nitrospirota bacterium]